MTIEKELFRDNLKRPWTNSFGVKRKSGAEIFEFLTNKKGASRK